MANEQKTPNLAYLLSGIFGALAGGQGQQQDQMQAPMDADKMPKPGQVTSEGIAGPVASVKQDGGDVMSDTWQQKLAQVIEDSTLKAVGKRTADMVATGQADPSQLLQQADQTKVGVMTGQQAFSAAQQQTGIDPAIIAQIQQAAPKVQSGLMDNLFQTPAFFGHKAAMEAAGQVGPTVMQNYMTEQLPLGTKTKAELQAGAWQAQVNAQLQTLDKIGTLRSHLAPVIEAELKTQPLFGLGNVIGIKSRGLKQSLKKSTAYGPEAQETIENLNVMGQTHPNLPRPGLSTAQDSIQKVERKVAYRAGETRNINGVNYKRGEDGIWKRQ